jgi:hypothetical protein
MTHPLSFAPEAAPNLGGALKASRAACSMHQLCLPMGLDNAVTLLEPARLKAMAAGTEQCSRMA